ncbi:MAG: DUF362 domain-containing protein [Candidatus Omnitrophota bacterium]|jgi:uncharacterized protein (DUF362 family)|nr:MAG: DUF362 domain-containing protein [Candidatus Omnitrophota bacterium]
MTQISRRHFIRSAGISAFSGPYLWTPARTSAFANPFGPAGKSRVVIARREGILQPPNTLEIGLMNKLLDEAARALSDKNDPLDLWRALFSSSDVVGIKVNTLGGAMLSPHPDLVYAVAERLVQAGVSPQKIIVWDRSERELKRAGFDESSAKGRCMVLATDSQGVGYEREPEISGTIGSCFSRIVSQGCSAMINFGVLKDHDLSGTSVAMKNLFGLIHNPNRYHFDVHKDPYLPDLCLHPFVKDKLRLSICDGFRAQYDRGPAFNAATTWIYDGLLLAIDQVALDAAAATILDAKRIAMKLPTFKQAEREPIYIRLAEENRLGYADPARIEMKEATI